MEAIYNAVHSVAVLGSKTISMLVVSVVFLVLAWVSFALRVYVRAKMIRSFGKDDWMMLLTLGLFTTSCGLLIAIERLETGGAPQRALKEGPFEQLALLNEIIKYCITLTGVYILTTITLKISLAIFFLRIVVQGWQRKAIIIATSIYTSFSTVFAFIALFQCNVPTEILIKKVTGQCISDTILQPLNYIHGSLNAATDFLFALLPIFMLWNSQMPRSVKISAGFLLSLGAIGSISSLIRLVYVPGLKNGPNFFSNAINIGIWSIAEPGFGILAACLATLRPLFRFMVEKARSIHSTGNSSSRGGGGSSNLSKQAQPQRQQQQQHFDRVRATRLSLHQNKKEVYSGGLGTFSEARGYHQMNDDDNDDEENQLYHQHQHALGNFTSVATGSYDDDADTFKIKSLASTQSYELPIYKRMKGVDSTAAATTTTTETETETETETTKTCENDENNDDMTVLPTTIESFASPPILQNRTWVPDDEVLMTRRIDISR